MRVRIARLPASPFSSHEGFTGSVDEGRVGHGFPDDPQFLVRGHLAEQDLPKGGSEIRERPFGPIVVREGYDVQFGAVGVRDLFQYSAGVGNLRPVLLAAKP